MKQKVKKANLLPLVLLILLIFIHPDQKADKDESPSTNEKPRQSFSLPQVAEGQGLVLFDQAHGQTAGNADWVINGAFSDFADSLIDSGFEIAAQPELIRPELLSNCDIYIIPEPNIPFKAAEQAALLDYVEGGGILFIIADHYNADRNFNRWDATEIFNGWRRGAYADPGRGMDEAERAAIRGVESSEWLWDNFGFAFRYNAIDYQKAVFETAEGFSDLQGLKIISHGGATIILADERKVSGLAYAQNNLQAWEHAVDQGVYFGGRKEGPLLALAQYHSGYVLALADSSPLEDQTAAYRNEETGAEKRTYAGYSQGDHKLLFPKLLKALLERRPKLDLNLEPTPTESWELPEHSQELESEPWRKPRRNYRWYDPESFAEGAYTG
ncbi:MAG: hypothetical protein Q4P08_05350 [Eubacteriales bacterium]|nr:hypothetical protein [Eubacteriales bacterium]